MPNTAKNGNCKLVFEIVKDDPGVAVCHIQERLNGVLTGKQISNSLAFLRRTNQIQNLGKHAKGASWYPTK